MRLTKLNPSTSASSTQRSSSSAIWEGVPTGVEPRPPTVMSVAMVFLDHFLTEGEVWEKASTTDLSIELCFAHVANFKIDGFALLDRVALNMP